MQSPIYIVGDIHGEWQLLNKFLAEKRPRLVLSTGDFGYWPQKIGKHFSTIQTKGSVIRWCEGNHEDFGALNRRTSDEICPNVWYQPRGSILLLPDGRKVLFVGGADSIDKQYRTPGYNWFPEELPSQKDYEIIDAIQDNIDIVISHTCPNEFKIENNLAKLNDPTRTFLSFVLDKFRPKLWYFGHWHTFASGYNSDCNWTALDMCDRPNWWVKHTITYTLKLP